MRQFFQWLGRSSLVFGTTSSLIFSTSAALAQPSALRVVSFNVESGGADPATLASQIEPIAGVDLWGFSEVESESWALTFETAAEVGELNNPNFETVLGTTGGGDRLAIVYNADRFELVEMQELNDINPGGRVRAPLVAHLRDQTTGEELLFMVNHLYRSNNAARHQQAVQLNDWAEQQRLPVIAVGDYNFDWDIASNGTQRDLGFDNMIADSVFDWVKPGNILKTQCSSQFNSILDFVFLANQPETWQASSEILFPETTYCPDNNRTSDHRPVSASIQFAEAPTDDIKTQILQRIEQLEQELEEIQRLIEEQL